VRIGGVRLGNQDLDEADTRLGEAVPLMRPRLPETADLLPYLRRIDSARHYTNAGPLLTEFEARLAAHFGVRPEHVACVANGTVGLMLCLLALSARKSGLCILPSWTFEATAAAVQAVGLEPWFYDVDERSWALRASDVLGAENFHGTAVAAVVVVAPFGAAVDREEWDLFTDKTGIPTVIDAAAGFDSLVPGATPSVLSLHATKLLSTGEGGAVICTDEGIIARVRHLANYGFEPTRQIARAGFNAKMSEYAAAVGLAALDGWAVRRREIAERADLYRELLGGRNDVAFAPGFSGASVQPTCNVKLADHSADSLVAWLEQRRMGARKWWGNGCHRQPAFANCLRNALPVTEALATTVVGLPFFADLPRRDVAQVAVAVDEFLRQSE
jgi:dTDP-4-amino-4,6-dideoxygalactose transaminase